MKATECNGRTILTNGGAPVLVELKMRVSDAAPGQTRVKCVLSAPTLTHPGTDGNVPMLMPFARAVLPTGQKTSSGKRMKAHGYTPEFRLEMN